MSVAYSVDIQNGVSFLSWKVLNTEQIFKVQTAVVYQNHGLEYAEHFKLTLKKFREDFLGWKKEGFPEPWMKRYCDMFSSLIK